MPDISEIQYDILLHRPVPKDFLEGDVFTLACGSGEQKKHLPV